MCGDVYIYVFTICLVDIFTISLVISWYIYHLLGDCLTYLPFVLWVVDIFTICFVIGLYIYHFFLVIGWHIYHLLGDWLTYLPLLLGDWLIYFPFALWLVDILTICLVIGWLREEKSPDSECWSLREQQTPEPEKQTWSPVLSDFSVKESGITCHVKLSKLKTLLSFFIDFLVK